MNISSEEKSNFIRVELCTADSVLVVASQWSFGEPENHVVLTFVNRNPKDRDVEILMSASMWEKLTSAFYDKRSITL